MAYGAKLEMRKVAVLIALMLPGGGLADEVVVAALGDSLTQGYGLVPEQGFVPQLQGWIDEAGLDARVINAGVSGDTTAGGLSRVGWTLTPEVDAMIVALGGNDLLRGIDPEVSAANIEGILQAAAEAKVEVLLVGMEAPGNFGPAYKEAFDAIYPELAAKYGTVFAARRAFGLYAGRWHPSQCARGRADRGCAGTLCRGTDRALNALKRGRNEKRARMRPFDMSVLQDVRPVRGWSHFRGRHGPLRHRR